MSRSKDTDLQSLMTRCGSTLYSKPVPENHVQNEAIEVSDIHDYITNASIYTI